MKLHRRLGGVALAVLAILLLAAVALAATPKKGAKFKGTIGTASSSYGSAPYKYGKYLSPVSFEVSKSGKRVSGFRYGYLSCSGGSGGPVTSNPYTGAYATKKVGVASIAPGGTFAVSGSKAVYKTTGSYATTYTTTSAVSGKFTSAKKATGTITLTQATLYNGKTTNCGPVTLTWSAKAS